MSAVDLKGKAIESYEKEDYEGFLEYAKRQYDMTKSQEDWELCQKAKDTIQLKKEIDEIIALEGKCSYKILGVNEKAPMEDIKKAFRVKATKYHPDRAKVKGSHDAMRIIQQAYFELNTEEKRASYDNKKRAPRFVRNETPNFYSPFVTGNPSFFHTNFDGTGFSFSTSFNPNFTPFMFGENLYSQIYRNSFARSRRTPPGHLTSSIFPFIIFIFLLVVLLIS